MNVFVADEQEVPVDIAGLKSLVEYVLNGEGFPERTEMAVLLVGEAQIAEYNSRFLQRAGPTDVVSLPIEDLEPGRVPAPETNGPPISLGDVFICPAVVAARAVAAGVPFDEHMALMTVHGTLHLLGYDHAADADADLMEARERDFLSGAGPTRS